MEKNENTLLELQKCLRGDIFNSSETGILDIIFKARRLTNIYNTIKSSNFKKKRRVLKKLAGAVGNNVSIDTPFYCDYGKHIFLGNNVIVGMNCTFVDCNKIIIGNNVLIASNVQIYTSTHPVDATDRLISDWDSSFDEPYYRTYALPVTIKDNSWICGGVIILPGVTIGKNCVIGAGSVVTKSIPDNTVAAGNPCKVSRKINSGDNL